MKIACLGGAGRICREAVLDLVRFSEAKRITVADVDERAGREVVAWLDDPRVDFLVVDVRKHADAVNALRGYDVAMDGTMIALNGLSTACIAAAGCHAINLNGFGEEDASDEVFRANGRTCVPGFGMTPGITQMMAMRAAAQLEAVEIARVSHGAYRPIAFSASITETTTYEYDPVEVEGTRDGRRVRHTLWHTHPPSDGTVPEWAGLRAYTRNVGIPMSIGAQMLGKGMVSQTGVITPEEAFEPASVIAELARRDIHIHEKIEIL